MTRRDLSCSAIGCFSLGASRAHDAIRWALTGYKNVMTKDALSLPHLLRGEVVSELCGFWESEAIRSGKSQGRESGAPNLYVGCSPARRAPYGSGGPGIRVLYWACRLSPAPQPCSLFPKGRHSSSRQRQPRAHSPPPLYSCCGTFSNL